MAWRPREWRRSRRPRLTRAGVRQIRARTRRTSIAATITTPRNSAKTGSDTMYLAGPPKDSATSPGWSATQAAPAAASAIRMRNRTMRSMKILLGRFGERRHGLIGELTGRGERGIARRRLVEPGLRRRAVGGTERGELAPRFIIIVADCR